MKASKAAAEEGRRPRFMLGDSKLFLSSCYQRIACNA